MTAYPKPLPAISDANRPYWDALRRRELRLLRCASCARLRVYPFRYCPHCGHEQAEWTALSGRGTIWSVGIFHQIYFEGFRAEAPYAVVVVELDEGPRVYSNIVGTSAHAIRIGDRVEAVFEDVTAEVTLLKFRIVR
jgi:hypothetical protein